MAKVQQGYLPDKKTGIQRFMPTDPQDAYELREARSEIARHHRLITEMRDLLTSFIDPDECWFDHHGGCQAHDFLSLEPGEICPNEQAKRLLNRQVS